MIVRINVDELLMRSAARAPDRFSYRTFNNKINRAAHGLLAMGYKRGDALGLMSPNIN